MLTPATVRRLTRPVAQAPPSPAAVGTGIATIQMDSPSLLYVKIPGYCYLPLPICLVLPLGNQFVSHTP